MLVGGSDYYSKSDYYSFIALIYLAILVCHILYPNRSPPAMPSMVSIVAYLMLGGTLWR